MPITEQQLKEWEEMEKRATPGPWDALNSIEGWYLREPLGFCLLETNSLEENDIKFVSMARTALPLLIEEVRSLNEEVDRLYDLIEVMKDME